MVNFYNTTAVIVDDTDPDIYYNGAWNHKHDVANDLGAYNSSWTDAFGAGLSATYTFEGMCVLCSGWFSTSHAAEQELPWMYTVR